MHVATGGGAIEEGVIPGGVDGDGLIPGGGGDDGGLIPGGGAAEVEVPVEELPVEGEGGRLLAQHTFVPPLPYSMVACSQVLLQYVSCHTADHSASQLYPPQLP